MPRFIVRPEGDAWRALAQELERMTAMVCAPEVNLNDLGRSLAGVVRHARGVFVAAGLPSVRMDAAAKALDLTTGKSALEAFTRAER